MSIRDVGNRHNRTHHPSNTQRTSISSSNNRLLFKCMEAIPLKEVKMSDVVKFIKHHVLYRFGMPRWIIHDNGPQFVSQASQRFCNKCRIQSVSSTTYYPAANSLAEAFIMTTGKLLKKFISKSQHDWDEKLGECLWACCPMVRTPTKATPFFWVYGCEAIYHWRFRFHLYVLPWQWRWQTRTSIGRTFKS